MAVPYHTHTFEIPTANKEETGEVSIVDKVVVPASLGTAAVADADDFATAAQGALADTAVQPGEVAAVSGIYVDRAAAVAATIDAGITSVTLKGDAAEGDGLGGLWIDADNGSTDTFTSNAGARTWYRVKDVGDERLSNALLMSLSNRSSAFNPDGVVNNSTLDHTIAIKLTDPAFATATSGEQGGDFDPIAGYYYSPWTRANSSPPDTERLNIVRHNLRGAVSGVASVVDYGATTGVGSGNADIDFGHGQCLNLFRDDKGFLNLLLNDADGRGLTFCEYQEVGSRCADPNGYDIIVLAGQSNQAGVSTGTVPDSTLDASDTRILEIRNGASTATVAVEPLGHPTSNANGYGPGPGLPFAKLYADKYLTGNRKVLLLPVAVSSTGLTASGPWAVGGSAYNNMLAKIAEAVALASGGTNRVVGMLWSQGETDANRTQVGGTSATQAEYTAAWNAVIDGFRASTATAATAFIIAMGMEPAWVAAQSYRAPVEAALADTPAQRKWTTYVAGPAGYSDVGNELHFNAAGNRLRGELAFAAINAAVENTKGVAAKPGNVRRYIIQPVGVTAGTVGMSKDKELIIKTGGPYLGGKNIRVMRTADLLALSPGDYSAASWLWEEIIQPELEFANQGATAFDGELILLNGNNLRTKPKYLNFIRLLDGRLMRSRSITPGQKLAAARVSGAEPEGLFWIGNQLWTSLGMKADDGSITEMFLVPLFQGSLGDVTANGNRNPQGVGVFLEGGSRKLTHFEDEALTFATVSGGADGSFAKLYMQFKALVGDALRFVVNNPTTGAETQVYSVDRATGKMTFDVAPDVSQAGAWTPGLTFGGGSTGLTFSTAAGRYVKNGRHVTAWCRITMTAKGSSTGSVSITGLPFTPINSGNSRGNVAVSLYSNLASIVQGVFGMVGSNSPVADLRTGGAASSVVLTHANFTDTSDLILQFTYETAS